MDITIFARGKIDRIEKKKYISDLIVDDEGAYWESRDRRILAEKRVALGHAIRYTERVISCLELSGDDDRHPEVIAALIENALLREEKEGQKIL